MRSAGGRRSGRRRARADGPRRGPASRRTTPDTWPSTGRCPPTNGVATATRPRAARTAGDGREPDRDAPRSPTRRRDGPSRRPVHRPRGGRRVGLARSDEGVIGRGGSRVGLLARGGRTRRYAGAGATRSARGGDARRSSATARSSRPRPAGGGPDVEIGDAASVCDPANPERHGSHRTRARPAVDSSARELKLSRCRPWTSQADAPVGVVDGTTPSSSRVERAYLTEDGAGEWLASGSRRDTYHRLSRRKPTILLVG